MLSKHADLLVYILKAVLGTAIGFYLYRLYPTLGGWCLFSIILVLSPDRKDAVNLALTRIKANLVGAAIGLVLLYLHPINLVLTCVGIAAALALCEWLKLQAASRSATIAVLIITMHEPGHYFWDVALERAGGVIVGCVIGVVITYVFHHTIEQIKRATPPVKT